MSKEKHHTFLFLQKLWLWTIHIESDFEENLDKKNHFRIGNLPDPINLWQPVSQLYVDKNFNDPNIGKENAHVDYNDKNV